MLETYKLVEEVFLNQKCIKGKCKKFKKMKKKCLYAIIMDYRE